MGAHDGRRRRGRVVAALLLLTATAGSCTGGDGSADGTARRDLAGAGEAAFTAHGSVEQVWLTGAEPGRAMELVDTGGAVVATGTADDEGSLLLRDVPPGDGYRVAAADDDDQLVASPELRVTAPDDHPDADTYAGQELTEGYGYLETRDGTLLAVTVRLPGPVEDGPYPTVVEYSGYAAAHPDEPQPTSLVAGLLGYATVGVNMRGTGCSGGAFEYFEPLQSTDGYDIVETVAAQDWVAGGRVGMVGLSYSGISQLFVAATRPPGLAAIAPLSVISDTVRGTLAPGGIRNTGFATEWAEERRADAQPGGQPWSQDRIDEGDATCADNQALRGQSPDIVAMIEANAFWTDELAAPLAPEGFVDRIDVPVFLAGAWQDEQTGGYFAGMLDAFTGTDRFWATLTNGTHIDSLGPAVFGRWTEFLSLYVAEEVPALPASAAALVPALGQELFGTPIPVPPDRFDDVADHAEALARFEADPRVRLLLDNGAGAAPGAPVPTFEVTAGAWPPEEAEPLRWYLAEGGDLATTAPEDGATEDFTPDPTEADVTTMDVDAEASDHWVALPPYSWERPSGSAALTWETAPLEETLVVAGPGSVDLWLGSTADDADVEVTLSEVRPDGTEVYVQSGWLRASHRALHPDATDLRPLHLHTEDAAEPLPAGELVEARVELFPVAHAFRAGSRLRLEVGSPGGARPRWRFDTLPVDGSVTHRVGVGADTGSSIVLPVLSDVAVPTPAPPCPSLRGQPCREAAPVRPG